MEQKISCQIGQGAIMPYTVNLELVAGQGKFLDLTPSQLQTFFRAIKGMGPGGGTGVEFEFSNDWYKITDIVNDGTFLFTRR
jgi:hypothetical protein